MITAEKKAQLEARLRALGIDPTTLVERFVHGSGRGGQKLNKTASCVQLQHLPSGIEIKCQQTRSREDNRFFARRRLCEQLEQAILGKKSPQQHAIDAIRRQKQRRARRSKQKATPLTFPTAEPFCSSTHAADLTDCAHGASQPRAAETTGG